MKTTEHVHIRQKSLEIPWLSLLTLNGCVLIGVMVYGYWQIETRIRDLENQIVIADETIGSLLDKHIVEERVEREELAEKVKFYEREINLNPFAKKRKK